MRDQIESLPREGRRALAFVMAVVSLAPLVITLRVLPGDLYTDLFGDLLSVRSLPWTLALGVHLVILRTSLLLLTEDRVSRTADLLPWMAASIFVVTELQRLLG